MQTSPNKLHLYVAEGKSYCMNESDSSVIAKLTITMVPYGTDSCQNCPFPWGSALPSNTWFLGPTQVSPKRPLNQFKPFFSGLTSDRYYTITCHSQTSSSLNISSTDLSNKTIPVLH